MKCEERRDNRNNPYVCQSSNEVKLVPLSVIGNVLKDTMPAEITSFVLDMSSES